MSDGQIKSKTFKALFLTSFLTTASIMPSESIAGPGFKPGPPGWNYYSIQNLLIGATMPLQASANYGEGVTVATLDTGITSSWVGFEGINISSHSCLNNVCGVSTANNDANGHGTFVASEIVGGVQFSDGNGMIGVAPFANLVSVKVLNDAGSGARTDIANGIRYAADQGAKVINLSLGPKGSTNDQVLFYNGIASAINYAASKKAIVILAGGNSGTYFVKGANLGSRTATTSNFFTDEALQRLLLIGATNSNKVRASYSNIPANGSFYSKSGRQYWYPSLWLMADGGGVANGECVDCIVGAPNDPNANYLRLSAGTSMAAPQAAGAAALLAARWPVLINQGSLTRLLRDTATDLGTAGTDAYYGKGFINLERAFQSVGTLSVYTSNGNSNTVTSSSISGSMTTGSALGAMSSMRGALTNYTVFDSYQRDFTMNLAGLIITRSSSSPAAQNIDAPVVTGGSRQFADGSRLSFGNSTETRYFQDKPGTTPGRNWYVSFTNSAGSTSAAGSGFPSSASFASALWGEDRATSNALYTLGASQTLLNLSGAGRFLAYGTPLGQDTRLAFSWNSTQTDSIQGNDLNKTEAASFGTALATNITRSWKAGITLGLLDETNGLLGTRYTNGLLSLGEENRSTSLGISSSHDLGHRITLVFDAALIRNNGSTTVNSLISDISPLYGRTYGVSLGQTDAIQQGDNMSVSFRAPLKVFSGSANLAMASVDEDGNPLLSSQRINLTPDGNELSFSLGYAAPVNDRLSWNMSVNARNDAENIKGNNDADVLFGAKLTF